MSSAFETSRSNAEWQDYGPKGPTSSTGKTDELADLEAAKGTKKLDYFLEDVEDDDSEAETTKKRGFSDDGDSRDDDSDTSEITPNITIDSALVLRNCWTRYLITFQSQSLEKIVQPIERTLNGIISSNTALKTRKHAYLYLQHQENLACWRNSLCAILGWNIHPEINSSDWLTACLVSFAYVPKSHKEYLDRDMGIITDVNGDVIFKGDIYYDLIPATSQSKSFIYDEDEIAFKLERYATWLLNKDAQSIGLQKVNFFKSLVLACR